MPPTPPPEVFSFGIDPSLEGYDVSPQEWLAKHDKHWDGLAVGTVVFDGERVLLVQRAAHDSMPNKWEVPGGAADGGVGGAASKAGQIDGEERGQEGPIDGEAGGQERGQEGPIDGEAGGKERGQERGQKEPSRPTQTILEAAARELWEEAGLVARRYTRFVAQPGGNDVGGHVFTNRTGRVVFCRLVFVAQAEDCSRVRLDPDEHQAYVWATEEEVRQQRLASGRDIALTAATTQAVILEGFRLRGEQ